jgi:hypothetical protein
LTEIMTITLKGWQNSNKSCHGTLLPGSINLYTLPLPLLLLLNLHANGQNGGSLI